MFCTVDKARTQCIRLHIPTDVEEVSNCQDGGILEPTLIDMASAGRAMTTLQIGDMSIHYELHVRRNLQAANRP